MHRFKKGDKVRVIKWNDLHARSEELFKRKGKDYIYTINFRSHLQFRYGLVDNLGRNSEFVHLDSILASARPTNEERMAKRRSELCLK